MTHSPPLFTVRGASEADVTAIMDLAAEARIEIAQFRGHEHLVDASAVTEQQWAITITSSKSIVLVALSSMSIVGYAKGDIDDKGTICTVSHVFVDPQARQLGIGAGLVGEIARDAKGKRDGDNRPGRPPRDPNAPKRPASNRPDGTTGRPARPSRPHFTAPPEMPKRPTAKRLKPKHVHRTAVLETLPVEQRGVAERALEGGIKAVRDAVKLQNDQLRKDGKPEVPSDGLISMAQNLLPKLRVADWLDKAEAAKSDLATLDLRDLRSVVVASEDPMVVRDETTRALASELKVALKERQDAAQTLWLSDIIDALKVGRTVRALKMTSEPPKAGQPFPSELGAKLAAAAVAGLTTETAPDRWIALLEALAFSPIRGQVKLATMPQQPTDALLATVKRLSPLLPQIATLFGIEVAPGLSAPRPLRPTRPVRVKPNSAQVKPVSTEPAVTELVATEPVATEPEAQTSAE